MKKLEAFFQDVVNDDVLSAITEVLVEHDVRFHVVEAGTITQCYDCKGWGMVKIDDTTSIGCTRCNGTGKITN